MNTVLLIPSTLLCSLLLWAVISDVKKHRISNWLVIAVLGTGFVMQVDANGAAGMIDWLGGSVVGVVFFLPFYIGRGMGAGDVKLMGGVCSALGPWAGFLACGFTLFAGLLMVLAAIFLRNMYAQLMLWRSTSDNPVSSGTPLFFVWKDNATRIPYAGAIAMGGGTALWQFGRLPSLLTVVS
jgi:prepilin peptidase CpaA